MSIDPLSLSVPVTFNGVGPLLLLDFDTEAQLTVTPEPMLKVPL
jgi:hypothetical protein